MDEKLLTGIFAILGFLTSAGVNFFIDIFKENARNNKERRKELYVPVLTQIKLLRRHVETINLISVELEIIAESDYTERPGRYEELVNFQAKKEEESNRILKNLIFLCEDKLPFSRLKDFENFISLREFLSSASSNNEIYNPDLVPPLTDAQLQDLIQFEKYFSSKVKSRFSFG